MKYRSVLSKSEIQKIKNEVQTESAINTQNQRTFTGFFRLAFIVVVLALVAVFAVQQVFGIPVFTAIGNNSSSNYSSGQLLIARVILGVVVLSAGYYLYRTWSERGGTSFVHGEIFASNPVINSKILANQQVLATSSKLADQASVVQSFEDLTEPPASSSSKEVKGFSPPGSSGAPSRTLDA